MYRRLSTLSGISIICVVLNHTSGWGLTAWIYWAHRYQPGVQVPNMDMLGTLPFYISEAIHVLSSFVVPAFLFISGFYMAYACRTWKTCVDWKSIRVRITALLIPYTIWTVFIFAQEYVLGARYTIKEILLRAFLTGANQALYYVPVLVMFYLLSPWFVELARKNWKFLLIGSAVVQLIPTIFRYLFLVIGPVDQIVFLMKLTPGELFFRWAFYFPFGLVAGLNIESFKHWIDHNKRILLILVIVFYAVLYVETELIFALTPDHMRLYNSSIFFQMYGAVFILAFLAYDQVVPPFTHLITQVSKDSYGIYLTHLIFMSLFAKVIYHIAPWVLSQQILLQPLIFTVGLGIPLTMMIVVRKSSILCRGYPYLFG